MNPLDFLPEGVTPLEWAISVKCLDNDGTVVLFNRPSEDLNTWEALGMATSLVDDLRDQLRGSFVAEE